jgi:hypothetical protein
MRRTTSLLAMLAIFSFPCLSAFADSAEQKELLGLMKKLNGVLEGKSGTEAALPTERRRGEITLIINLPVRVGNTVFCTVSMSAIGALSYTQTQTVRSNPNPPGGGITPLCIVTMRYNWPHVDPNNVIQLNVVVTENCACPETPYRVSHDLPSINFPPNGVTVPPIGYTLHM